MKMVKLKDLIKDEAEYLKWNIPMRIICSSATISKELKYHIEKEIPLGRQVFRYGSEKYFELIEEVKSLYNHGKIKLNANDIDIVEHFTDEQYEGFYLNHIYEDNDLDEAEYRGKKVDLNKPKRGGSKKFYVYVKNPKSGKVKKIEFGAKDGGSNLSVKLQDPEAKKNFAARHNCEKRNDPTTASYWSCRLPRYAKKLGLKGGGKWW